MDVAFRKAFTGFHLSQVFSVSAFACTASVHSPMTCTLPLSIPILPSACTDLGGQHSILSLRQKSPRSPSPSYHLLNYLLPRANNQSEQISSLSAKLNGKSFFKSIFLDRYLHKNGTGMRPRTTVVAIASFSPSTTHVFCRKSYSSLDELLI